MTLAYTGASAIKARLGMGTAVGTADALIATIADQVNAWMESKLGRPVGPGGTAIRYYDGDGTPFLHIRDGVQSVTSLTVYDGTNGAASSIGTADYYLDPPSQERRPGWPATRITFSDAPAGSWGIFPKGKRTVKVDATWGWSAIPTDLSAVADKCAVSEWRGRASAGGETFTIGADGTRTFERYLSLEDKRTLDRYATDDLGVG